MEKQLFIIGYGLSGGYGGIHDYEVIKADNLKDAEDYAFLKVCDYYDSYIDGCNLRDVDHIVEAEGVDEDEAYEMYLKEREDWIEYVAMEYNKENLKKIEGYHVWNPFSQEN